LPGPPGGCGQRCAEASASRRHWKRCLPAGRADRRAARCGRSLARWLFRVHRVVGEPGKNDLPERRIVFGRSGTIWSQQAELDRRRRPPRATTSATRWPFPGPPRGRRRRQDDLPERRMCRAVGHCLVTASRADRRRRRRGRLLRASVALSASTAVVGAYGRTRAPGRRTWFVQSGAAWSQQAS